MAVKKYIANNSGKLKEEAAVDTSAGAGDAGKIVALDSNGKLNNNMMPTGVGAEVVTHPSSENLTAGNFVNLWNDSGTIKVRKADATDNTKPADGFVLANVTSPANADVYLISGQNDQLSALTLGGEYYLSTTPGAITATAPSSAGNIVQRLGKAVSATKLIFENQDYFELS
jgi:hypothetical protein